MINQLPHLGFGCDPEIFFNRDGEVIGAERLIAKGGLSTASWTAKVVLDGVQAELHPGSGSIPVVTHGIAMCFAALQTKLQDESRAKRQNFTINYSQVVTVPEVELLQLSPEARVLGCQPSFNIYKVKGIKVPENFPIRSAAGHLHMNLRGSEIFMVPRTGPIRDFRQHLVPLMDILVGNTMTILDRDPQAAERRKLYGRAGEFRLPTHGLEYRTPSNYWLKATPLFHLLCGMASIAAATLAHSIKHASLGDDPESDLSKLVDLNKVKRAINTNSVKLAMKNWEAICPFIEKHVPDTSGFPVHKGNLALFNKFLEMAAADKLAPFLPADPLTYWAAAAENSYAHEDFRTFLNRVTK